MTPREETIVAEARRWLGTPYHHAADLLGVGVDCALLVVRVYVDTGIVAPFDPRPYPPDWYLHRDEERFKGWIEQFGDRLPDDAPLRPGDVPLFRWGRCTSHGGIVETGTTVDDAVMIHANRIAGRVERAEVRGWADRLEGFWRIRT